MRLLLDTHVFLWYILADVALPTAMRDAVQDPANEVYLSVVSLWEVIIKHQLGKLPLPQPPETYIVQQRIRHGILSLPVDEATVARLTALPALHKDPFDRLLICQAQQHSLTLVTVDAAIQPYPVARL